MLDVMESDQPSRVPSVFSILHHPTAIALPMHAAGIM
jgi:hypothetical protein